MPERSRARPSPPRDCRRRRAWPDRPPVRTGHLSFRFVLRPGTPVVRSRSQSSRRSRAARARTRASLSLSFRAPAYRLRRYYTTVARRRDSRSTRITARHFSATFQRDPRRCVPRSSPGKKNCTEVRRAIDAIDRLPLLCANDGTFFENMVARG